MDSNWVKERENERVSKISFSVRRDSARKIQANLAKDSHKTSQTIIEESLEAWGRLDVLVNNASQFYPTKAGEVTQQEWGELLETNLTAPFFLSQVKGTRLIILHDA